MVVTDFRMATGIVRAERAKRIVWPKTKGNSPATRLGLRYENRVEKQLAYHVGRGRFVKLEHNPWFTFYDTVGPSNCSPDFLLWTDNGVLIVEVKYTWVEVALMKLAELYCPVISAALGVPTLPLVICRNVTAQAPMAAHTLSEAITSRDKLLQWPDNGRMIW